MNTSLKAVEVLRERTGESMEQMNQITGERSVVPTLQTIGVASTAVGAVVLLVEGLGRVDAVERFLSFSGILSLCAALGLRMFYRQGDERSARLLLMMYLALVPVFWSQLGAVVYEVLGGDGSFVPSLLRVEGVSVVTALIGFGIGVLVITPFSALVFRILTPMESGLFTGGLTALGLLTVFPDRSGFAASAILVISSFVVFFMERNTFSHSIHLTTREAKWARGVVLLMVTVLIGRGSFYGLSHEHLAAALTLSGSLLLFFLNPGSSEKREVGTVFADSLLACSLMVLVSGIGDVIPEWAVNLMSYSVPAVYLLLSGRSSSSLHGQISLILLSVGSVLYRNDPSAVSDVAALLFPLAAICVGVRNRNGLLLLMGLITGLVGYYSLLSGLLEVAYNYRWSVLMLSGIGLVFGAPHAESASKLLASKWATPGTLRPVVRGDDGDVAEVS